VYLTNAAKGLKELDLVYLSHLQCSDIWMSS
jgi:hypothetical protein